MFLKSTAKRILKRDTFQPMNARPMTIDPILASDAERTAQIDAKLARFGNRVGQHGALAAVQERLAVRISRDTSLRLTNLSRAVGLKHSAMLVLILDTASRIEAAEFFAEVARIQGRIKG